MEILISKPIMYPISYEINIVWINLETGRFIEHRMIPHVIEKKYSVELLLIFHHEIFPSFS